VTSKRRELTSPSQGNHYRNGKGTGIKGTQRFPSAFPELFPETKGTHTAEKVIMNRPKSGPFHVPSGGCFGWVVWARGKRGGFRQLRFSVDTLDAKRLCAGTIKTKISFCGYLCNF